MLLTGELNVKIYVNEVGVTPPPKIGVFNAEPGGVIHQLNSLLNVVAAILPKPDAVIVIPFKIIEDPNVGKVLTVGHIGQTGVGVGVGVNVFVGVGVGVTSSQG